jgi:CBS domain-containing protein
MTSTKRNVTQVSHPILRLEVVHPNGVRSSEHRVFCRYQQRSVAVGTCCACAHCDSIVAEPAPAVNCTIAMPETSLTPDRLGVRTAVGEILAQGAVALDPDATIRDALALLRLENRRSVAIVDATHVVIGVIHEAVFATNPSVGLPAPRSDQGVAQLMSGTLAIHEAVPVRRALELLAAAHLREATVVDDKGVPLGVFRDVDGLRWIVAARDAGLDAAS